MILGEIITRYREEADLSQRQFALKCGLSNGYISMLEKNENPKTGQPIKPNIDQLNKIANAMGMTLADLLEKADDMPVTVNDVQKMSRKFIDDSVIVPILGKVAAGIPLFAEENIVGQIRCSEEMAAGCELFALKVEGDSMLPRIHDGDILIVRQQDDAETGDIVIALVNGDDGCVKKLVKYDSGGCALISLNPVYEPMVFDKAAVYEVPVRIVGKVIEVRSPM